MHNTQTDITTRISNKISDGLTFAWQSVPTFRHLAISSTFTAAFYTVTSPAIIRLGHNPSARSAFRKLPLIPTYSLLSWLEEKKGGTNVTFSNEDAWAIFMDGTCKLFVLAASMSLLPAADPTHAALFAGLICNPISMQPIIESRRAQTCGNDDTGARPNNVAATKYAHDQKSFGLTESSDALCASPISKLASIEGAAHAGAMFVAGRALTWYAKQVNDHTGAWSDAALTALCGLNFAEHRQAAKAHGHTGISYYSKASLCPMALGAAAALVLDVTTGAVGEAATSVVFSPVSRIGSEGVRQMSHEPLLPPSQIVLLAHLLILPLTSGPYPLMNYGDVKAHGLGYLYGWAGVLLASAAASDPEPTVNEFLVRAITSLPEIIAGTIITTACVSAFGATPACLLAGALFAKSAVSATAKLLSFEALETQSNINSMDSPEPTSMQTAGNVPAEHNCLKPTSKRLTWQNSAFNLTSSTMAMTAHPNLATVPTTGPTVRKDPVSRRQYYAFQSLDALPAGYFALPPLDKFLIGTFHDQARFLTHDGTLVVVNTTDVQGLYRTVTNHTYYPGGTAAFYLTGTHAQIEFTCVRCDAGNSHHMFYDDNDLVGSKEPKDIMEDRYKKECAKDNFSLNPQRYHLECTTQTAITFHLTNTQSHAAFNALGRLNEYKEAGQYKFVKDFHACEAIFPNVYNSAGFAHHYSLFLMDQELRALLDGSAVLYLTVNDRFYHAANGALEPGRSKVHSFSESVLGKDFATRWDEFEDKIVEPATIRSNSFIENRIEKILSERAEVFSQKMRICFDVLGIQPDQQQVQQATEYVVGRHNVTYNDLFYWYTEHYKIDRAHAIQQNGSSFAALNIPMACAEIMDLHTSRLHPEIAEILGDDISLAGVLIERYPYMLVQTAL